MAEQADPWLDAVKDAIKQTIAERSGPIVAIAEEHLANSGKFIRPHLISKVVEAAGGTRDEAIEWAAAIELLHNATLIHDDYQDGDTHRRGEPTVWVKHGGPQAINAGDYLWSAAFHIAARRTHSPDITLALIRLLSEMAMEVVDGQAEELSPLTAGTATREHYLKIIRGKTSGLFRTPARGALLIAGATPNQVERLSAHFEELGLLFQLQDDLLDLYGDKGRTHRGEDLREGKLSFLIVKYLELFPDSVDSCVEFLKRDRESVTPEEADAWISLFRSNGTLSSALDEFRDKEQKIVQGIASEFPDYRPLFNELISMVKSPIEHLFVVADTKG